MYDRGSEFYNRAGDFCQQPHHDRGSRNCTKCKDCRFMVHKSSVDPTTGGPLSCCIVDSTKATVDGEEVTLEEQTCLACVVKNKSKKSVNFSKDGAGRFHRGPMYVQGPEGYDINIRKPHEKWEDQAKDPPPARTSVYWNAFTCSIHPDSKQIFCACGEALIYQ